MTDWDGSNNNWATPNDVSTYNATSQSPASSTPIDHTGSANVTVNTPVTDNNVINDPVRRVTQQQVIPSAIKSRLMQPVSDGGAQVLTVSGSVDDGKSVIVNVITSSSNGGLILGQVYWQVYIDNLLPTQRMPQAVSSKFYPFYVWSNFYDDISNNTISNEQGTTVGSIQVRNAIGDGSSHLIFIQAYARLIVNGEGQNST